MSSHGGERDHLSHVSSSKGTNSTHGGSPPSPVSLSTITLKIRASTFGFGGNKHSVHDNGHSEQRFRICGQAGVSETKKCSVREVGFQ